MRHAEFGSEKHTGEFGSEFLLRVVRIAKPVRLVQRWSVQPRAVAGPVGKLMKGGPEKRGRIMECILRGQVDAVGCPAVEGSVVLVMGDPGAAVR